MGRIDALKQAYRTIPDFPAPGILFKDITPILQDPGLFRMAVDALREYARARGAEVICGIESRGFVLGAPVSLELGIPFVPIRKAGKLPARCVRASYELEYGTAEIEMHEDAIAPGSRVVIIDDLLATGGTARASCELVERVGGIVAGLGFITELTFLHGRDKLGGYDVESFVEFGAGE